MAGFGFPVDRRVLCLLYDRNRMGARKKRPNFLGRRPGRINLGLRRIWVRALQVLPCPEPPQPLGICCTVAWLLAMGGD